MFAWPKGNIVITPILILFTFGILIACSPQGESDNQVLVFAAASLTNALDEVIEKYEGNNDAEVLVNYGGSQSLAQQIVSGAPADIFISAGEFPINTLKESDLSSEPLELLSNRLVVVIRQDLPELDSLNQVTSAGVEQLAIANPELAPAGRYAQESLGQLGLWEEVQDKLIRGMDVRATLAYVESGNADAAIVYETDATIARSLKTLDIIPEDSYSPVIYPAALVKTSANQVQASLFLEFLQSRDADEIFRKHGFTPR